MTPAIGIKQSPFTLEALREIIAQEGPCITLEIPDHHAGAKEPSRAALVRGMARLAEDRVLAQKLDATVLLQPIEEYAAQFETEEGGARVALFRAPHFLTTLTVPGIRESRVTLGRYFNLAPLIRSGRGAAHATLGRLRRHVFGTFRVRVAQYSACRRRSRSSAGVGGFSLLLRPRRVLGKSVG